MMKSMYDIFLLLYPLLINLFMIMILSIPTKINKLNPLTLMFILIIMTLYISKKMNLIYNSWISFILFIAMIGGLMIIYLYITSLANNELFNLNYKSIMMNLIKILPLIILLIYIYMNTYLNTNFNNQDSWNMKEYMYMFNQLNLNSIYNETNNKSSYFMMMYLYYSMICIMNICYKFKAPMRQLMF